MPNESKISVYEEKFPGWKIGKSIGNGSGGKTVVYEIYRKNYGFTEDEVLKVVSIIDDIGLNQMNADYRDAFIARREAQIKKALAEVQLMSVLQDCNNIVPYQDYSFCECEEENHTSVELLIRMHRYKDLNSILKTRGVSQEDVVNIGIDICTALEGCIDHEIIHRDIKPENIFYNDNHYFLGDFGISRILEDGNLAQTSQGTAQFAAPEQFANLGNPEGYDYKVDIYSLGLTLYVLANNNRLPFMDQCNSSEYAYKMRVSGAQIPPIEGVDPELNRILLKACAYSAEDRYNDCHEMKKDLCELQKKLKPSKTRRANKSVDIDFETERNIECIRNYATDQAIRTVDKSGYETEKALKVSVNTEYATEQALKTAGDTGYATEQALKTITNTGYQTEEALKTAESVCYETERALKKPNVESYATEKALGRDKLSAEQTVQHDKNNIVRDRELGVAIASINTEDIENPISVSAKKASNVESTSVRMSDEEIRKIAVDAMAAGNNDQAFEHFATLAEKDDWDAMYNEVTKLFNRDSIIEQRTEDAIFWFDKCISNCKDSWTISLAEFQLGDIYAKGIGIKKNHKMAEKYYRSSASKGNPYAKKKFVAGKYVK